MNKVDKLAKTLAESTEIKDKKKTSAYDTIAKVVRIDGNTAWVAIDGGVPQTPAIMVVNAKEGDNVRVRVGGGKAYVTGNATAPPTDDRHVLYITKEAVDYIAALKDKDVTVRTITAAAGYIDDLHAKSITTEDLKATTGYIKDLTSENITAKDITADHATIDTLDSTYATIHELHSDYAEIDLANVNNAWINNGVIKDAAISDAQIVGVSANKLTAGTIDAGKINVANLRAKNLIVEKLNGQPVFGGLTTVNPNSSGYKQKNPSQEGWYEYVNAQFVLSADTTVDDDKVYYKDDEKVALYDQTYIDGLAQDLNERIDGAVETFTGAAVPTLINYPAVDWTEAQMASHVGDIYYVINAGQSTDGYCYRFAYDNQTETYEWILIKDSDVTAALQRLVTAEGDISGLKTFETNTESWITDTDEELGSLKTRTTILETNMGDKVAKTTYNEVKQTVDENSAVITDLTEWQTVTPDGQTTTGYKNIVNKVNQTATTNKSSISSLETTVGDSGSGLVKKTSDIEQTVNGISTKVTAIEGWEIGGRNLLLNTALMNTWGVNNNTSISGGIITYPTATSDTWREAWPINVLPYALIRNKKIVFSCKVKATSGASCALNFCVGLCASATSGATRFKYRNAITPFTGTGTWENLYVTIDVTDSYFSAGSTTPDYDNCYFTVRPGAVNTYHNGFQAKEFKLETGNKVTDWTPAPEDTDAEISALESSITQTADKISLVVKSGTSASNLELTDAAINAVADNMVIKSSTDNSKTVIQGGKLYADQIEIGSLAGEIGGRNLVFGTSDQWVTTSVVDGANKGADLASSGKFFISTIPDVQVGDDIQISFDIKFGSNWTATGTGTKRSYIQGSSNQSPWTNISMTGGNKQERLEEIMASSSREGHVNTYFKVTSTMINGSGDQRPRITIRFDYYSGDVSIKCVKIEKASKPSNWTPAPEDGSAVNLVPWPYYGAIISGDTYTSNGITWTVNLDGSITATGTATANSYFQLAMENHPERVNGEYCLPTGTYTLSGCPSEGSSTTCRLNIAVYTTPNTSEGSNSYTEYGDGITFTPTSAQKYARIQMMVRSGCTCPSGGYTFYPMLEVGSIKHSFVSPRINEGAASTATSYITRIDDAGIFISPSNQSPTTSAAGNSVKINADGMNVYKGGTSVAEYGDSARIGKTSGEHVNINNSGFHIWSGTESTASNELAAFGSDIRLGKETSGRLFITSDGIDAYTPNGIQLFSLNKNGGLKNQYARLKQWQTTAQSVNLSTTLGSAWTNLPTRQIFRIRGACYYETASDVGVAYARPFEQFTKGISSTGTAIAYDGNNTLTISTSGIPSGGTYEYSDLEFLKVDIVPAPFYSFADDAPTSGGANSFVVGTGTVAGNPNQLALGAYNAERPNGLLIIGGGTSDSRKNLAVVTDTGDLYLKGNLYVSSNDAGTSGTKANSGIDIASHITFGSAWTQQVKVARRIGNMVFFQLEANAGSFNANTNYVLANIASGYRPAVQQFATGITTDGSYNPKGTVSAVLKTDGSINIRTQTASSSGAFVFISGFYYTA